MIDMTNFNRMIELNGGLTTLAPAPICVELPDGLWIYVDDAGPGECGVGNRLVSIAYLAELGDDADTLTVRSEMVFEVTPGMAWTPASWHTDDMGGIDYQLSGIADGVRRVYRARWDEWAGEVARWDRELADLGLVDGPRRDRARDRAAAHPRPRDARGRFCKAA